MQQRGLIEPGNTDIPVSRQCSLLGLPRSSYYYTPAEESPDNLLIMNAMDRLHTDCPFYGYRRLLAHLPDVIGADKWSGIAPVNGKRIRSLMRKMDIHAIYPRPNLSKKHPTHTIYPYLLRNVPIEKKDHVWSCDITYIPVQKGFFYLMAVIDWHTRFVLSWKLSNTMDAGFCEDALEDAFSGYGKPQIFNTDQGSQFTSKGFTEKLLDRGVKISMDGRGRALDNVFIERLWRTVKYEHVYLHVYDNGKTLHDGLSSFFEYYNYKRKHSSLGYNTPAKLYL